MLIRINKLLSQTGVASLRKADELIKEGAISLNGKVLKVPGVMVDTDKDRLTVNGKDIILDQPRRFLYFAVNKPEGYITTVEDTHQRRTVMELLPEKRGLFPVGRLDKDTSGIILVTNDGELAHRLMHHKYEIPKSYKVKISGYLSGKDRLALESGVDIKDKRPSIVKIIKIERVKRVSIIFLEIHEGRKRQIRRTFEALGYKVNGLQRINYAGIDVDTKEGSFRQLKIDEIAGLKERVGLK